MSQRCCCFSNTTIPFDASSIFSNSTFSPKGAITFPAHEYVWLKVKDCSAKPISARRARFVPYYSGLPESLKNERHAYTKIQMSILLNFGHVFKGLICLSPLVLGLSPERVCGALAPFTYLVTSRLSGADLYCKPVAGHMTTCQSGSTHCK